MLSIAAGLVMALGLAGCSTTNDRGVNINRNTDLFGAAPAQPASETPNTGNAAEPQAKS